MHEDLILELRTACSPDSRLGKLCERAAAALSTHRETRTVYEPLPDDVPKVRDLHADNRLRHEILDEAIEAVRNVVNPDMGRDFVMLGPGMLIVRAVNAIRAIK